MEKLLKSLQDKCANMSIKVHFLHTRRTISSGYQIYGRAQPETVGQMNDG